jgi:hypothetical protein
MEEVVITAGDAWRERILAHQASGQSVRSWCRENQQQEHAFYSWRSRLGLSPKGNVARTRRSPSQSIKFAEVVVNRTAGESIRLCLSGGRELHLPMSMPIESVAQLIRAIEGAA